MSLSKSLNQVEKRLRALDDAMEDTMDEYYSMDQPDQDIEDRYSKFFHQYERFTEEVNRFFGKQIF